MSTENLTNNHIQEFNEHFQEYKRTFSEIASNLLNRELSLLSSSVCLAQFDPNLVDTARFYINLHVLTSTLDSRSILFWSSLAVIEQACKNPDARQAIVQKFKFVPVLGKLLGSIHSSDRKNRLLHLLQDLTYGIKLLWQEPYLKDLLTILLSFIYDGESKVQKLSISILINLCYKNLPCFYLVSRLVNKTELCENIKHHGMLACKLYLLLESNSLDLDKNMMHKFIKYTFTQIYHAVCKLDIMLLRHVVDFFIDTMHQDVLKDIVYSYADYVADFKQLISRLDSNDNNFTAFMDTHESYNKSTCFSILFEFIIATLDLNIIEVYPELIEISLKWINSVNSSITALKLLNKIILKLDILKPNESIFNQIILQLPILLRVPKQEFPTKPTSLLLKFFFITIKKSSIVTQQLFTLLKDDFFNNFFEKVTTEYYIQNCQQITNDEVEMYLHGFNLLIEFIKNFPKYEIWQNAVKRLLETKTLLIIFSNAILSEQADLCQIALELCKVENFPILKVAELITSRSVGVDKRSLHSSIVIDEKINIKNNFLDTNDIDAKLNEIIPKILSMKNCGEIYGSDLNKIAEVFEYKSILNKNTELELLMRLDSASSEITTLSHRNALLSADLSKSQTKTLSLTLNQEKLKTTATDSMKLIDKLKHENRTLLKTFAENKKFKTNSIEKYENLLNEFGKVKDENDELNKKNETNLNEIMKLYESKNELLIINNELKSRLDDYEQLQSNANLVLSEQQLLEHNQKVEQLMKIINSHENKIKQLEIELLEKKETIYNFELKLTEMESMRNAVVQMMQNNLKIN